MSSHRLRKSSLTGMALALETRACRPCASAKRRCGKETPHCLRCGEKGWECTYPPTKPTCFVPCGEDNVFPVEQAIFTSSASQSFAYSPRLQTRSDECSRPPPSLGLSLPGYSSNLFETLPYTSWFNSPETWKIDRFLLLEYNSSTVLALRRLLEKVRRWLTEWVEKGSNPFVHSRLYETRFPRCIQDVYTTLSTYLHQTASNEQITARIIEDRVKDLVAEHSVPPIDSFEHLARVQALLVYQILCLYDGDIRMRHIAESNIPVLYSWMEQMVENASHAVCLGSSVISSAHEQNTVGFSPSDIDHGSLLWCSWVLAESIRRTWLVASGIQGTYLVIQQSRAIACKGGMMFTTRQGVWGAQSARAWEKMCSEVNVGLMQVAESGNLFLEVGPEDVDDFTLLILQATFGEEKMEGWAYDTQD